MRARVLAGLALAALFVVFAAPFAVRQHGARAPVWLHRWLCRILRIRLARLGRPAPGARLIVANHVSWIDILVLGAMEPMTFLAKKEIGQNRWTRGVIGLQGAVYVDRERKRCIPDVNAAMARRMASGGPVTLFAEATTSDGTRLLRFRSSHFEAARRAGVCVHPVYLDYRALAGLPASRAERARIAWYGEMTFRPSLWRLLASGGVTCHVHYGEPIKGDGADRKTLARQAEAAMRALKARARAQVFR